MSTDLGVAARKAAEPLNLAGGSASAHLPLQDSKTENLDRAHSMDLSQLEPDTSYCARVRVKPISDYDGIWSEWSNEYTWTTDWGMSLSHHHTPGTAPLHRAREAESHSTLCPSLWDTLGILSGPWGERKAGVQASIYIGLLAFLAFVAAMMGQAGFLATMAAS